MDAEKEKRFRFRARLEAELAAEQAPAQEKKPLTLKSAALPGASREYSPTQITPPMSYGALPPDVQMRVSPGQQQGVAAIGDVLSLPTRAAGTAGGLLGYSGATGGKQGLEALADSETGLLRPARQATGGLVRSGFQGGEDGRRGLLDYGKIALGGAGYLAASAAEDPFALAGGAAKLAPKAVGRAVQKTLSPVAAAGKATREAAAEGLESGANRIQTNIIRPRQMDEAAGFKVENVAKHGVQGSLEEVLVKSQSKIEDAAANLKTLIKQGKDNGARVDLNKAVFDVEKEIFNNKAKEFANLREAPGALKDLKARIRLLADEAPRGKADLVDGQYVKQALGDMGAFEHIAGKQGVQISKEDRILSQMASRVYLKLKDQIEAAAPAGVKEENTILSELIPVNRAALYRKLVADRNNVLSMNDFLGAIATIGGGPKGAALWAASKATKSGATVKVLHAAAKALRAAKSPAEAEFYAKRLQSLGATAAEIEALSAGTEALQTSNAIPFRQVAEGEKKPKPMAMR